jgi:hypothetical protein
LRGNSRPERISGGFDVSDRQALAIAGALRENKGLVELNLSGLR